MSEQILLSGSSGAIGRAIVELIEADGHFSLAGEANRRKFFEPDAEGDVIIDFSRPELLEQVLPYAVRRKIPLVVGTTGLGDELEARIVEAAEQIAICHAANFSLGINLLVELAGQSARALGEAFDIEVLEAHHRRKVDAPSGTARWLGQTLASARGLDFDHSAVHDRSRERRPRRSGEIGYQSIRGGDIAGEHTVFFLADGERLELTHRATDRRVFARGALAAARGIMGRPAGMFDFSELVRGSG